MKVLYSPEGEGAGGGAPNVNIDMATLIPAEFKDEPSLAGIKDVPSLVKGYVHAQRMVGQDKVVLPRSDWGDKEYGEFYDRLGRPANSGDYAMPEGLQLHESIQVDDEGLAAARQEFHKLGLTKKQGDAMLAYYFGTLNQRAEAAGQAQSDSQAQATEALKTEWGDDYDTNLQMAQNALKRFGDEELSKHLVESGLGNDPRLVKLFHKIATNMGEDNSGRGGEGGGGPLSQEAAVAEINRLRGGNDEEFNRFLNGDKSLGIQRMQELQSRWDELHRIAFPGTQS